MSKAYGEMTYTELIEEYHSAIEHPDYDLTPLTRQLFERNGFESPLDSATAHHLINQWQEGKLFFDGGYPVSDHITFTKDNNEYTVVAFGVSHSERGAIHDMLVIDESLDYGGDAL